MPEEFRNFLKKHGDMTSTSQNPTSILRYIQITYEEVTRLHKRVSRYLNARHNMIFNEVKDLATIKSETLVIYDGTVVVANDPRKKALQFLKEYKGHGRIPYTTDCECLNAYIAAANAASDKIKRTKEVEHNRAYRFLKIVRNVYSHNQEEAKTKYSDVANQYWNDNYSGEWDDGLYHKDSGYAWFTNAFSAQDVVDLASYFNDIAVDGYDVTFKLPR